MEKTIILKCNCGSLTTVPRPLDAPIKALGMNTVGCIWCAGPSHNLYSKVYNFKYDYMPSVKKEDLRKRQLKLF